MSPSFTPPLDDSTEAAWRFRDTATCRAVVEAVDHERRRVAQLLHDTVCQSVNGVNLLAQVITRRVRSGGVAELSDLAELAEMLGRCAEETQGVMSSLAAFGQGVKSAEGALSDMAKEYSERVECTFVAESPVADLKPAAAGNLLGFAREAAEYALRETGATKLCFHLAEEAPEKVVLSIRGHGGGFRSASSEGGKSLHLRLLQARAALLGGSVRVEAPRSSGATISLHFSYIRL